MTTLTCKIVLTQVIYNQQIRGNHKFLLQKGVFILWFPPKVQQITVLLFRLQEIF